MCDDDNGRGEARRSSSFQRRPDRTAYAVFSIGGAPKTLTRRAPLLLLHRARSCFEPGYTQECGAIGKCVAKRRYTLARNDRRMWSTLNRGQTEKSLPWETHLQAGNLRVVKTFRSYLIFLRLRADLYDDPALHWRAYDESYGRDERCCAKLDDALSLHVLLPFDISELFRTNFLIAIVSCRHVAYIWQDVETCQLEEPFFTERLARYKRNLF